MVLLLVPKERLREVKELLARPSVNPAPEHSRSVATEDPWKDLLGSSDDD